MDRELIWLGSQAVRKVLSAQIGHNGLKTPPLGATSGNVTFRAPRCACMLAAASDIYVLHVWNMCGHMHAGPCATQVRTSSPCSIHGVMTLRLQGESHTEEHASLSECSCLQFGLKWDFLVYFTILKILNHMASSWLIGQMAQNALKIEEHIKD